MEALHRRARLSCRVDDHYYSVPFGLLRETVEARFTDGTIEVFYKGERIASHMRSRVAHKHTTIPQHMPSSHRRYAEWSPARMMGERPCECLGEERAAALALPIFPCTF